MFREIKTNKKGFTLIELLIVIAIIAILAAIIFIALDPLSRFKKARDARRWADIVNIVHAVKLDQIDNGGTYAVNIAALTDDLYYTVGTCAAGGDTGCTAQVTQAACADLTSLVTDGYVGAVPKDPASGTDAKTDYWIQKKATGIITMGACDPEDAATITITR